MGRKVEVFLIGGSTSYGQCFLGNCLKFFSFGMLHSKDWYHPNLIFSHCLLSFQRFVNV